MQPAAGLLRPSCARSRSVARSEVCWRVIRPRSRACRSAWRMNVRSTVPASIRSRIVRSGRVNLKPCAVCTSLSGRSAIMQHHDARNIAVAPEVRRNCHVELRRVQVGQFVKAQRRLMTVDAFDFFVSVPGPQRPKHEIGSISCRKQREPVDAAVLTDPVPDLHMIRMRVLGESGRFGLLRGEEALLLLGELEEPPRRLSVRLGHNTILQLSCCYINTAARRRHPRLKSRLRQGYGLGACSKHLDGPPEIKGLAALPRQSYALFAAKIWFKAHFSVLKTRAALRAAAG